MCILYVYIYAYVSIYMRIYICIHIYIYMYRGFHKWGYIKWMVYKYKIPLKWVKSWFGGVFISGNLHIILL